MFFSLSIYYQWFVKNSLLFLCISLRFVTEHVVSTFKCLIKIIQKCMPDLKLLFKLSPLIDRYARKEICGNQATS
jgi:hypothetical protein